MQSPEVPQMDRFSDLPTTLTAPARDAIAITPSDGTDIASLPRAVYVGTAGHLAVQMVGGATVTFQNVPAGALLAIRPRRVLVTGTTASNLVALW
jgi:hypothetical protein